jgi:hypothetical protein
MGRSRHRLGLFGNKLKNINVFSFFALMRYAEIFASAAAAHRLSRRNLISKLSFQLLVFI